MRPSRAVMCRDRSWKAIPYTRSDLGSIGSLLQDHYDRSRAEQSHPAFLRWQYELNPAGPPFAWLAKDEQKGGEVVGHYGVIPLVFKVAASRSLGSLSLLSITHSGYRRQGVFSELAERTYDDCRAAGIAFTYGFPNPNSYHGLTVTLRFRDIGRLPLLVRIIDPGPLCKWRIRNRFFAKAVNQISRAFLPVLLPAKESKSSQGMSLHPVETFDGSFDKFWEAAKQKYPVLVVRNAEFLNWRYTSVPFRDYRCFTVRRGGDVKGYIVARCTEVEGIRTGVILDLLVEPSKAGRDAGKMLVTEATGYFVERGAAIAACQLLAHTDEFRILREQGYLVCPTLLQPQAFRFCLRCHGQNAPQDLLYDARNWFISLGDNDVL